MQHFRGNSNYWWILIYKGHQHFHSKIQHKLTCSYTSVNPRHTAPCPVPVSPAAHLVATHQHFHQLSQIQLFSWIPSDRVKVLRICCFLLPLQYYLEQKLNICINFTRVLLFWGLKFKPLLPFSVIHPQLIWQPQNFG